MGSTTILPVNRRDAIRPPGPPDGRVLVVDDEPALLRMYARVLRAARYDVVQAADGEEARRLLQHERIDIVLSDVCMPRVGGLDVLKEARSHDPDLPVVLVTGAPLGEAAAAAIEGGVLLYLPKPLDMTTVVRVIDLAHRLSRLARLEREALGTLAAGDRHTEDGLRLVAFFAHLRSLAWEAHQRRARGAGRGAMESESATPRLGDATSVWVSPRTRDLLHASLRVPAQPRTRLPDRVAIALTECSAIDEEATVRIELATLQRLGFQIGFDDPDATHPGKTLFGRLDPGIVSLDAPFGGAIRHGPRQRAIAAAAIALCHDAGLLVAASGVDSRDDGKALADLGCDFLPARSLGHPW